MLTSSQSNVIALLGRIGCRIQDRNWDYVASKRLIGMLRYMGRVEQIASKGPGKEGPAGRLGIALRPMALASGSVVVVLTGYTTTTEFTVVTRYLATENDSNMK